MPKEHKLKTTELLKKLLQTRYLGRFFNRYDEELRNEPFNEYITSLCKNKNCLPADIIKKSGIERVFGHQLFNGTKNPSRDKVIQLAIGFEMDNKETAELLKMARKCALSPKVKRDAAIIYALEKKMSMIEIQTMLLELELPILGEGKYHE